MRRPDVIPSLLAFALAAGLTGGAFADGNHDAAKNLVTQRCATCHKVPGQNTSGLADLEAPSFQEIADHPDIYTEMRLRTWLKAPHWPMPQFNLSDPDIDSLVDFLHSLKQR